ncbi:MAG: hypothetical protein CMJ94_13705 [Planctomycetes bacterium]|mgnify:CR=1 FL=1|nr:hypothetical protein [Planctomycetota bacterium]
MHLRTALFPILLVALAAATLLPAQRGTPSFSNQNHAKLIVAVDGDPGDWANWGFLWDAGERRNGRP